MFVSKHHYAWELANGGNKVYFIEPPSLKNIGISINASENKNISVVTYRPVIRGKRFFPSWLYNRLLGIQIKRLLIAIGDSPDIIWTFHPYLFEDLNLFGRCIKIFHPVDFFTGNELPGEASSADICFCSSEGIRQIVEKGGKPTYFINHGLSASFCEDIRERLNTPPSSLKKSIGVNVGYIGNLLMEALDRLTMKRVIESNPDVNFHFWGQDKPNQSGLGHFDSPEVYSFIEFLKEQSNVILYGPVASNELKNVMKGMDMFWICWNTRRAKIWNEYTNPHKILEYLATGKPIVSHYMHTYAGTFLIDMLSNSANDGFVELFAKVMQRVIDGEPSSFAFERMRFALNNSYAAQIGKIEEYLLKNNLII